MEGDCDNDGECASGLKCGSNNCPRTNLFNQFSDCCFSPLEDWECYGGSACCTHRAQHGFACGEGDGDCDNDNECAGDLVCVENNCNVGPDNWYAHTSDCCISPSIEWECNGGSPCCAHKLLHGYACDEGEGDCANDGECQGDLVCGRDNCDMTTPTFASTDDCCRNPTSDWYTLGDSEAMSDILFHFGKKPLPEAVLFCESHGARVFEPRYPSLIDAVIAKGNEEDIGTKIWLGITDEVTEGR